MRPTPILLLVAAAAIAAIPARARGDGAPGAAPGDATITCEQIAAELSPYVQQLAPIGIALGDTSKDVVDRGKQRIAEETPAVVAATIAATASHADPTGVASRAVGQAEAAHQREVWQRSLAEDKPLNDKYAAQAGQLVEQAQSMQSNARLQRLMQLVQEKHCDGRASD